MIILSCFAWFYITLHILHGVVIKFGFFFLFLFLLFRGRQFRENQETQNYQRNVHFQQKNICPDSL